MSSHFKRTRLLLVVLAFVTAFLLTFVLAKMAEAHMHAPATAENTPQLPVHYYPMRTEQQKKQLQKLKKSAKNALLLLKYSSCPYKVEGLLFTYNKEDASPCGALIQMVNKEIEAYYRALSI